MGSWSCVVQSGVALGCVALMCIHLMNCAVLDYTDVLQYAMLLSSVVLQCFTVSAVPWCYVGVLTPHQCDGVTCALGRALGYGAVLYTRSTHVL